MQAALAAFLFWMAVRLSLPDDMIANTSAMAAMRFQPEWCWTLECVAGGLIGVYGIVTACRRCEFVATTAMLSAHLSIGFFLAEGGAALLPGALVIFVCLCMWVLWRSWSEVK